MAHTTWLRQSSDNPLFPDLLWSRPENLRARGKLLIIGGNLHGLAAVSKAYEESGNAGIGSRRIILPESLRKQIPDTSLPVIFAPTTPSGSFAKDALGIWLEESSWADGVLFAGDISRNSETAILLEKYLDKFAGQVTLTQDAADYTTNTPQMIKQRPDTTIVVTIAQLQKLFRQAKLPDAITMGVQLPQLIELLLDFHKEWGINIITKLHTQLIVVADSQASVTDTNLSNEDFWRIPAASHVAVWWLQNPRRTFETLTSACSFFAG